MKNTHVQGWVYITSSVLLKFLEADDISRLDITLQLDCTLISQTFSKGLGRQHKAQECLHQKI